MSVLGEKQTLEPAASNVSLAPIAVKPGLLADTRERTFVTHHANV